MAYCVVTDLLMGSIPLPSGAQPQAYVDMAAEEIDAVLGSRYVTPIAIDVLDPATRPAILTLKNINRKLATGRLILAADAGGQDETLHAYGLSLVKEAQTALLTLSASSDSLPGAVPIPTSGLTYSSGPRILNKEPVSLVDGFYDSFSIGRRGPL